MDIVKQLAPFALVCLVLGFIVFDLRKNLRK